MPNKGVRVNVTRLLNTKAAKKVKRNGRDVIVVPSATMPDNIIMNRVFYPAEEIANSYKTLERTPAPFNHPELDGKFISAKDPEGLNVGYIGAWNENVRQENGKVYLDKVIDVQYANQSEDGKRVLAAIEKGEAIHTSTGLFCYPEMVKNNEEYDQIAREIEFDHDAILLDFNGAATPEQGVGMFVNAQGKHEDVITINSIWEDADRELDWAVQSIAQALERKAKAPWLERIKTAITEAIAGLGAETQTNSEEAEMSKELDDLSAKVDALAETFGKLGDTIVNGVSESFTKALKPLVEANETVLANQKAQEETEKNGLIDKIVKANLLDEEVAKATPVATLRALANSIKENKAAPVLPGKVKTNTQDNVSQFKLPGAKKEA